VLDSIGTQRQVFFEEVPESYTGIGSIGIINAGVNYTSTPVITITGDGTGATATATIVNGRVRSVEITNAGINYTQATVSITDPFGSEASLVAKLRSNYGTLRTYYYRTSGEKVFINENAGIIDYVGGRITINNLYTVNVVRNPFYDENILTFNVVPESGVISPLRNRLLAIDTNNAQAIQLKMVPTT